MAQESYGTEQIKTSQNWGNCWLENWIYEGEKTVISARDWSGKRVKGLTRPRNANWGLRVDNKLFGLFALDMGYPLVSWLVNSSKLDFNHNLYLSL